MSYKKINLAGVVTPDDVNPSAIYRNDKQVELAKQKLASMQAPLQYTQDELNTALVRADRVQDYLKADSAQKDFLARTRALGVQPEYTDMFKDATLDLPEYDPHDLQSVVNYQRQAANKQRALNMIAVSMWQADHSPEYKKEYENYAKVMADPTRPYVDKEALRYDFMNKWSKRYEEVANKYGAISDEMLLDPDFRKYMTPDILKNFLLSRDEQEKAEGRDGLGSEIARASQMAVEQRAASLRFKETGNKSEYDQAMQEIATKYQRSYDSNAVTGAVQSLAYMLLPAIDHPLKTAGAVGAGIVTGIVTGNPLAGMGMASRLYWGGVAMPDSYDIFHADVLNAYDDERLEQFQKDNPNATPEELAEFTAGLTKDKEDVLQKSRGTAALAALLDVAGNRAMMGGSRVVLKDLLKRVQEKLATNPLKQVGKEFAKGTVEEVLTEFAQDALTQTAGSNIAGADDGFAKGLQAGLESGTSAIAPTMLLTGLFSSPHLVHATRQYLTSYRDYNTTATRLDADKKARANAEQSGANPQVAGVYDKILQEKDLDKKMLFNPADVLKIIQDNKITGNDIPEPFRDMERLRKAAANNEEITLTRADWFGFFNTKQMDAFNTAFHYEDIQKSLSELYQEAGSNEAAESLSQQISDYIAEKEDLYRSDNVVAGEFQNRFAQMGIGDGESQAAAGRMIAGFCRSIADAINDPKVTPEDIANIYLYKTDVNQKVGALNLEEGKPKEPYDPSILGKTDPVNHLITFAPNAEYGTMVEELAHSMLFITNNLIKEGKGGADLALAMQGFKKWLGDPNIDLSVLTEQNRWAHEAFAAALKQYIVTGHADKDNIRALQGFKSLLRRVASNRSIYGDTHANKLRDVSGQKQSAAIGRNYKAKYGHELPTINEDFDALIRALFKTQLELEEEQSRRDFNSVFDETITDASGKQLSPEVLVKLQEIRAAMIQTLKDCCDKEQAYTYPVMKGLTRTQMNKIVGRKKGRNIKPASIADRKKYQQYEELAQKIKDLRAQYLKLFTDYISDTSLAEVYQIIRDNKINANDPNLKLLTEGELNVLRSAGIIANEGGLSAQQIHQAFTPFTTGNDIFSQTISQEFGDPTETLRFIAQVPSEANFAKFFADQLAQAELEKARAEFVKADKGLYIVDNRLELNKAETDAFFKQDNSKVRIETIKNAAKISASRIRLGDVNPSKDLDQASRARKAARKAFANHEFDTAFKCLTDERFYLERAKILDKAKEQIEKSLLNHIEFCNRSRQKIGKTYDLRILDLNKIIMTQMGIKGYGLTTDNFNLTHEATVKDPDLTGFYNQVCRRDGVFSGFYKNKNVGEIMMVLQTMDAVKLKARRAGYIRNYNKEFVSAELARAELVNTLAKHKTKAQGIAKDGQGGGSPHIDESTKEHLKDAGRGYSYTFMRPENFFQEIDGDDVTGAWHRYIYQPMKNAEVRFATQAREWISDVRKAAKESKLTYSKTDPISCPELKFSDELQKAMGVKYWTFGVAKEYKGRPQEELMGVLLHMGNEDNFNKFLKGYFDDKVTPEIFTKWFNRMCDEGYITKEMMDYAQKVWDVNEKYFKGVEEAFYETHNYEVKIVQPRMIHTKWGDYRGGVVRALTNEDAQNAAAVEVADLNDIAHTLENNMPSVKNGFTFDRKAGAIRPLCVDANRLISETRNFILYANMQPVLAHVNKLIDSKTRAQLEQKYPNAYEGVIKPWLITSLQQRTSIGSAKLKSWTPILTFIGNCTRFLGQSLMIGNINNTLQGLSNFSSLATKVKLSEIARASAGIIGDYRNMKALAMKSEFMRNRINEYNDGIQNIFNDVVLTSKNYTNFGQKTKARFNNLQVFLSQHAYFSQKFLQDQIDIISFNAAFNQAIKQGKAEHTAMQFAESVVRTTQGSFDISDMTAIEKSGAIMKIFVQFGGYFYTMFRLCTSQIHMTLAKENLSVTHKTFSVAWTLLTSLVAPAVIAEAINGVMNGSAFDDDDDDGYTSALLASTPKLILGALPVAGKFFTPVIESNLEGKNYVSSNVLNNPTLNVLQNVTRLIKKATREDSNWTTNDIRGGILALSVLAHIPAINLAARPIGYMYGYETGEYVPQSWTDFARGLITGTASPQSKQK